MTTKNFPEQLSDMWRTRPARLPDQGHVAGVCAGIGVRYGVDGPSPTDGSEVESDIVAKL